MVLPVRRVRRGKVHSAGGMRGLERLAAEDTVAQELHMAEFVAGEAGVGYSLAVIVHIARMEPLW